MGLLDAAQRILGTLGIRADLMGFLVLFGLAMARMAAAVSLAPFLGGGASARIKVGLAVILTAVLFPSITPAGGLSGPINGIVFAGLLAKEALFGAAIGLLSQLVFYAVQMAGTLIDTQRGMNQLTFVAPQLPGHTSALGQLQFQAAVVLFLTFDGHLVFLRALHTSFAELPLLDYPRFQPGLTPLLEQMIRISADTLVIAVRLSAPVLLALFLVDVCFGAIGKVASQVNVYQESQPVKSLAGLAVLLLALGLIFEQLIGFLNSAMAKIFEVIRALR